MARLRRVSEVAELTGVSVRTLHHYDRLGLVHPKTRTDGGHRLYGDDELLRLQQVLTLRYLGFPLKRIRQLLDQPAFDLIASLRAQRQALRDRQAELAQIEHSLTSLLVERNVHGEWNWEHVFDAARSIQAQIRRKEHDVERYYTTEQLAQFAELREQTPEAEIAAVEEGWAALLEDVRGGALLPPESTEAAALLNRWDAMTERTTAAFAGYDDLSDAIGKNYRAGNFDTDTRAPSREDFAFIERIRAAQSSG